MDLTEGGGVGGEGKDPRVVYYEIPTYIFIQPCDVAPDGVEVSILCHPGGQILHGACGGGACKDIFSRADGRGVGARGT